MSPHIISDPSYFISSLKWYVHVMCRFSLFYQILSPLDWFQTPKPVNLTEIWINEKKHSSNVYWLDN